MRRAWASVTVTCLFSSAVAAQIPGGGSIGAPREAGEPELGTRLPGPEPRWPDPRTKAQNNGATIMQVMASCVLSRRPAYVDSYLRAPDRSPEAKAALHRLDDVMARCLTSPAPFVYRSLQMTGLLWRGALAEAYMRAHPLPLPAAVAAVRPRYEAAWIGDGTDGVVREMAACLAETHPAPVAAVLQSVSGTPDERAAMAALGPAEAACLRGGVTLHTNALGLRAALAEALFHREFDAAAQPAVSVAEKH